MKILILAPQPFFQHRGTPIATLNLVEVLAAEGHELDVLAFHEGEDIDVPNCTLHRIPAIPFVKNVAPGLSAKKLVCDFVMTLYLLKMFMRQRWDVVHAVEESVFMAMLTKWLFKVPYIYDMDSSMPQQILDKYAFLKPFEFALRFFERQAVIHSEGVVAVCHALEELAESYSDETAVVRIEDVSLLNTNTPEHQSPSELLTLAGPVIMYVGNLERYQGIDLLLDSFVHVYHMHPTAQLVIVGGSDQLVEHYQDRATKFGVAERTHWLGPRPVEDLGDYLSQADILVSPRILGNNTPMKIFSYLESNRPLLATRLSMHTQVLDDSISLLVDPTPLAMSVGLKQLIDNTQLRRDMAKRARETAERDFSEELMHTKLAIFFEEISGGIGNPSITR